MEEDYYALLGVPRTASFKEIKIAYRKKIREHHPDLNKASDAEKLAKSINQAYSVLSDSAKRQMYDMQSFSSIPQPVHTPTTPQEVWQDIPTRRPRAARTTSRPTVRRVRVMTQNGYFDIEFR